MAPHHEAGRLYDAYGASLYRYALMILARPEAAEDAVQQVFTALIAAPARNIENEEAYLRRAVRNACYSTFRHEQVRRGGAEKTAGDDGGAAGLFEPVPEHERNHHAYRRGTFVDLSAHGVIRLHARACRLHLDDARRHQAEQQRR
jgi:DNA-directed RNA polymerase specialized sigma24 family protein